jgi:hypothetical protein
MRLRAFPLMCCLVLPLAAVAAENWTGNYIVGGGVGGVECRQFSAIMDQAETFGRSSSEYARSAYNFDMYLLGFRTGYNLQTPDTCDIFGRFSNEQLRDWLRYYCRSYPLQRFGSGVVALAQGLHGARLRTCQR